MSKTIPLFDPAALKKNINGLGEQLTDLLKGEAAGFILKNKEDAALLGRDAVEAILYAAVLTHTPILVLPADATPDVIAAAESILATRTRALQIVAKAQREHSDAAARVQKSAIKLATQVISVVGALGIKALLG